MKGASAMSEPLDVRHLPYMPLQIERLRKSKSWLRCKRRPELAFYLLNLWMRAWHEVPAGSIEDDDVVLADAALCTDEVWMNVKSDVMHGWQKCGDRYIHPVVVELAQIALDTVRKNKGRTAAARRARGQYNEDDRPATDDVTDNVTEPVTGRKGREGKGTTQNRKKGISPILGKSSPARSDHTFVHVTDTFFVPLAKRWREENPDAAGVPLRQSDDDDREGGHDFPDEWIRTAEEAERQGEPA